jgi:hypothetical protein
MAGDRWQGTGPWHHFVFSDRSLAAGIVLGPFPTMIQAKRRRTGNLIHFWSIQPHPLVPSPSSAKGRGNVCRCVPRALPWADISLALQAVVLLLLWTCGDISLALQAVFLLLLWTCGDISLALQVVVLLLLWTCGDILLALQVVVFTTCGSWVLF